MTLTFQVGKICSPAVCVPISFLRVLTRRNPPRRFFVFFFEVLPFATLASSVSGRASRRGVPGRRGGVLVCQYII